jgi:hypothetical protein
VTAFTALTIKQLDPFKVNILDASDLLEEIPEAQAVDPVPVVLTEEIISPALKDNLKLSETD